MMLIPLKRLTRRALTSQAAGILLATPMRNCATVLMLHRFRQPELGIEGHDPEDVRLALEALRRHRFPIIALDDLFCRLREGGPPLRRAVAFTIDDGYLDQATIGASVFREFDAPVTTFVTTGFLDRTCWLWWDKIEYVFSRTRRWRLVLDLGSDRLEYAWDRPAEREVARDDLTARCKEIPDANKHSLITQLSVAAEIDLPVMAPPEFQPMLWDDVRRCETGGMRFGPHTVTHPVLARTEATQARGEIDESWKRLCEEARNPVPIFCYPNGKWGDFGTRESAILRTSGFLGALTSEPGYANGGRFGASLEAPFQVRRFEFPSDPSRLLYYASGAAGLAMRLRGQTPV